jgi:DNA topoisomerase-1
VDLACGDGNSFRANGSTVVDPGFMAVYQEGVDDAAADGEERMLPPLEQGEVIDLADIRADQHFTEPPPRYSEASLVKTLEEYGIGRPSTYASIISTLQAREYVLLEKRRFMPTDVGRVVSRFLTEHFTRYVDYDFTAKLEDELDAVSRGEKEWVPLMKEFWGPFKDLVDDKETSVSRSDVTQEKLDENCPECGKPLSIRLGRSGRFIGCSGFPDCKYTRNVDEDAATAAEPQVVEGRKCPKCESDLIIRRGRYGKFIGCSSYPDCKYIEPLEKPEDTGVSCPTCRKGTMLKRKSRAGKIFFSCSTYPTCKYAVWNEPVPGPCPKCGWPILSIKTTKKRGTERVCPQPECKFSEPWHDEGRAAKQEAG